jgi:two-component system response regulator NreC
VRVDHAHQAAGEERTGPSPASIRIVIADDHQVVRSGLRLLLEAQSDFEVIAEAGDAAGAQRHVRGYAPSVLVLDLNMPGGSSLDTILAIRTDAPDTQIVILTMENDPASAREALGAGAIGYVLKEAAGTELVEAVRRAAVGETYLNPELGARIAREQPPRRDDLSDREVQVLDLLSLGYTNSEIGARLHLSVRTVEGHRSHLQDKLGISSRAALMRYAALRGTPGSG